MVRSSSKTPICAAEPPSLVINTNFLIGE